MSKISILRICTQIQWTAYYIHTETAQKWTELDLEIY